MYPQICIYLHHNGLSWFKQFQQSNSQFVKLMPFIWKFKQVYFDFFSFLSTRSELIFLEKSQLQIARQVLDADRNSLFFIVKMGFIVSLYSQQIKTILLLFTIMIKSPAIGQLTLQSQEESQKLIVSSTFDVFSDGKKFNKVVSRLYENHIKFQLKNKSKITVYTIHFCFDLIFQLIREQIDQNKKWNISQCYSIKFQKDQKYVEFRYPQQKSHITIWRDHLVTKLKQRGFHQQFSPIKQIGKGNFANVYKVQNQENQHFYAVKAFNKQQAYSQQCGKEALINQIQVMRHLNHPNLMKIYGVYQSKNSLYICVELLAGQLFDKIKWCHKFKISQLRTIMNSILHGLQALHSKGYMHRDLKPENILFKEQGKNQCVIGDFGLVENIHSASLMFIRCGTPGYVAPEVVNMKNSKMKYDCSCDMFSLGIIFHILLLGKSPFPGKTTNEVIQQNKMCRINFDSFTYQHLPPTALSLLKGLVQKDPTKRLNASQALRHQFFIQANEIQIAQSAQPAIKELKEMTINVKPKKEPKVKVRNPSMQFQSPLMLSKNSVRKNQMPTLENSCLKFKMGENVIVDSTGQEGMKVCSIVSPLACKNDFRMVGQSRFRCDKQNHNS